MHVRYFGMLRRFIHGKIVAECPRPNEFQFFYKEH